MYFLINWKCLDFDVENYSTYLKLNSKQTLEFYIFIHKWKLKNHS